jgi:hypothetical protein
MSGLLFGCGVVRNKVANFISTDENKKEQIKTDAKQQQDVKSSEIIAGGEQTKSEEIVNTNTVDEEEFGTWNPEPEGIYINECTPHGYMWVSVVGDIEGKFAGTAKTEMMGQYGYIINGENITVFMNKEDANKVLVRRGFTSDLNADLSNLLVCRVNASKIPYLDFPVQMSKDGKFYMGEFKLVRNHLDNSYLYSNFRIAGKELYFPHLFLLDRLAKNKIYRHVPVNPRDPNRGK